MRQTIFEACRCVSARDAAEALGLQFGRNRRAFCPFCGSSHANMSFGNGLFYCFVCHAGGDAVKLASLVLDVSPLEAAKWVNREFACGYDEESDKLTEEAQQRIAQRRTARESEILAEIRRAEYRELVMWAERYLGEQPPLVWDGMDKTYMALLGMRHLFEAIWNAGTDRSYKPGGWLDEEVNKLAGIKLSAEPDGSGQQQVAGDKPGNRRAVHSRVADGRAGHSGVLRAVHPHGP